MWRQVFRAANVSPCVLNFSPPRKPLGLAAKHGWLCELWHASSSGGYGKKERISPNSENVLSLCRARAVLPDTSHIWKSYNIGQTVSRTREHWSLGVTVKKPQESVSSLAMKWCARKPGFILLHLPKGTKFEPTFLFLSLLLCVYVIVLAKLLCVCIGWVCWGIIGLKLCGVEFIKVSGALWWKLCEGISTMTIARVHAKWLVFSCFLMKILPSYFGSQGLNIALAFAVYAVSWIGWCHPSAGLRELERSKSCLACWESDRASIYLLCPSRLILRIQFVLVPSTFHLETDWLSASPSTIITK